VFSAHLFGEENAAMISRRELAMVIEARMEEIFDLVLQEIKRSGYDGLLPAGMVLTGGCSLLPGVRTLANRVLGLPVRIARPENMVGLTDQLHSPAYSTSVGLLYFALMMSETSSPAPRSRSRRNPSGGSNLFETIRNLISRLLP
jgi:cell division protein FtsA